LSEKNDEGQGGASDLNKIRPRLGFTTRSGFLGGNTFEKKRLTRKLNNPSSPVFREFL